jgi:hypothetical protein
MNRLLGSGRTPGANSLPVSTTNASSEAEAADHQADPLPPAPAAVLAHKAMPTGAYMASCASRLAMATGSDVQ